MLFICFKYKTSIFGALFLIFLLSCKSGIDYSETYTASKVEIGDFRLFTKNGELKNKTLIKRFISDHQSFLDFNYDKMLSGYIDRQSQIRFLSSVAAELKLPESKQVSVLQKGNLIYLEQKDTSRINMSIYDFSYSQPNLAEAMKTYRELFRDTVPVSGSSNLYTIRLKFCAYVNVSGRRLIMPMMNYWVVQNGGYNSGGLINNTFNISCTKLLRDKDTLLIQ